MASSISQIPHIKSHQPQNVQDLNNIPKGIALEVLDYLNPFEQRDMQLVNSSWLNLTAQNSPIKVREVGLMASHFLNGLENYFISLIDLDLDKSNFKDQLVVLKYKIQELFNNISSLTSKINPALIDKLITDAHFLKELEDSIISLINLGLDESDENNKIELVSLRYQINQFFRKISSLTSTVDPALINELKNKLSDQQQSILSQAKSIKMSDPDLQKEFNTKIGLFETTDFPSFTIDPDLINELKNKLSDQQQSILSQAESIEPPDPHTLEKFNAFKKTFKSLNLELILELVPLFIKQKIFLDMIKKEPSNLILAQESSYILNNMLFNVVEKLKKTLEKNPFETTTLKSHTLTLKTASIYKKVLDSQKLKSDLMFYSTIHRGLNSQINAQTKLFCMQLLEVERYDEAIQHAKNCEDPSSRILLFLEIATSSLQKDRNPDKALELIFELVDLDPKILTTQSNIKNGIINLAEGLINKGLTPNAILLIKKMIDAYNFEQLSLPKIRLLLNSFINLLMDKKKGALIKELIPNITFRNDDNLTIETFSWLSLIISDHRTKVSDIQDEDFDTFNEYDNNLLTFSRHLTSLKSIDKAESSALLINDRNIKLETLFEILETADFETNEALILLIEKIEKEIFFENLHNKMDFFRELLRLQKPKAAFLVWQIYLSLDDSKFIEIINFLAQEENFDLAVDIINNSNFRNYEELLEQANSDHKEFIAAAVINNLVENRELDAVIDFAAEPRLVSTTLTIIEIAAKIVSQRVPKSFGKFLSTILTRMESDYDKITFLQRLNTSFLNSEQLKFAEITVNKMGKLANAIKDLKKKAYVLDKLKHAKSQIDQYKASNPHT